MSQRTLKMNHYTDVWMLITLAIELDIIFERSKIIINVGFDD